MENNPRKSDLDVVLKLVRTPHHPDLEATDPIPLPKYQTIDSAGMDLCADVATNIAIGAGEVKLIPTGLKMEIPRGYEGQIRPRSGLATKKKLTVINAPGTIDSDYRGEVMVALINLNTEPHRYSYIARGERIAQLVIAPVTQVVPKLVSESDLSVTDRGEGGFGSTGSK